MKFTVTTLVAVMAAQAIAFDQQPDHEAAPADLHKVQDAHEPQGPHGLHDPHEEPHKQAEPAPH